MSGMLGTTDIPPVGEGKRGEKGYLGYLLRQAAGVHKNRMEKMLADLGITSPQFSTLTMIAAYPGHSNADLARAAMLTPQTLSVIIANLLKVGLVQRHAHQVHGRIQQLQLTEEGKRLLKAAKARVSRLERQLVQSMSIEEEQIVRRWLVIVAKGNHT